MVKAMGYEGNGNGHRNMKAGSVTALYGVMYHMYMASAGIGYVGWFLR